MDTRTGPDAFEKTFPYAAGGAGVALVSLGIAAFGLQAAVRYWSSDGLLLSLVVLIGLIGVFVGYFYAPTAILSRQDEVGFRYLLGPTLWFPKRAVSGKMYYGTLKLRVSDRTLKARIFGTVALPLGVNSDAEAQRLAEGIGITIG
jgi:Zn-dependent protease with chaperone function